METAMSTLGGAALLLISVVAVLALVILILYEAYHIVRLGVRLRTYLRHLQERGKESG
jgi:FtsH-binding integral membrane protein